MRTNRQTINRPQVTINRCKEFIGMMLVGDGVVALLEPERHVRLWAEGPKLLRMMTTPFVSRPTLTRVMACLELGLGLWLSSRQDVSFPAKRKFWKSKRRT